MDKDLELTRNVYDLELEKFVTVSPETQRTAGYVHQQILAGSLITAMALKKIKDDKLFLGLGCQSFEEYINSMLPFGRSTAFNYLKVANKLESVFPNQLDSADPKVQTFGHEVQPAGLDFRTLLELTKFDDDGFKNLLKDGMAEINGETITLDEIKDMTARETAKAVKNIKEKYSHKVDKQAAQIDLLISEKQALQDTIEANSDMVAAAEEKEKLYGAKASTYENKLRLLNDAEKSLADLQKLVVNANIDTEDSTNLQKKLVGLLKSISNTHTNFMSNYQSVTSQF